MLRNFDFFGAPPAAIISIHCDLGPVDALSVDMYMYIQTLLFGLTDRGLGTCVEALVAGCPDILGKEVGIALDLSILCRLAIGYSETSFPANLMDLSCEAVEKNV